MADRALILSADHYLLTDEKSGEVKELFQVWYINDYRDDSPTEIGSKPIKMVTTPEIFARLRDHGLPSLFDLELRSRPGKQNTAALTVVGVSFVADPKLFTADYAPKSVKSEAKSV